MSKDTATTLMEILVVLIVIGIFATLAVVSYTASSESVYDKDATTTLQLLSAAQQAYMTDMQAYYGTTSSLANINSNLKLAIPATTKWTYTVRASDGCCQAVWGTKSWHITIGDADGEPDSGACP